MMCHLKLKAYLFIWVLQSIFITSIEVSGANDGNKCDGNPLLTDSSRGRDITMIASGVSGMDVLTDVDSQQYKAVCWLIYDDSRQLNSTTVALAQRYVLALLYQSTKGRKWKKSYNFLSEKDECEWNEYDSIDNTNIGAICDEAGNIVQIDLRENNLDGIIPFELSRLNSLENLSLNGNILHSTIPYQLRNLDNLVRLNLASNKLNGTIPEVEFKNLQYLNFDNNTLNGTIPQSIFNLDKIESLYLQINMLSGTISSFASKYLRVLSLVDNKLTGALPDLSQSVSLETIDLQTNEFSGQIPDNITNLMNLKTLLLNINKFSGSIPSALFKLPNIQTICLWSNFLTGSIPNRVLSESVMEELHFQNNILTGSIPSQLAKMQYLQKLLLNNNKLSGEVPSELLSMQYLRPFFIQDNDITGTIPFSDSCDQIGQLDVNADCNTPKKVSCNCCAQCHGLYTSSDIASRNKLDCLSSEIQIDITPGSFHDYVLVDNAREKVVREKFVSVTGNATSTESSHYQCISLSDCFELKVFNTSDTYQMSVSVDGNQIIPKTNVGQGERKFTFGYSNNSIIPNSCSSYQICGTSFEPNTEKRKVINKMIGYLNRTLLNDDTSVQSKVLCEWTKYVDSSIPDDQVSYNLIQRYVLMLFYHSMNGPRWLNNGQWLSDESECEWHGVTCNKYGVAVDLELNSNNLTGTIPSEIVQLAGLENLMLSDNRIKGAIPQEIENMEALMTLKISNNQLEQSLPIQIVKLHDLVELDLSDNTLSGSIPNDIGELKNLVRMNLTDNFFSDLLPDQIYNLNKMISLSLSNNLLVGDVTRLSKLLQLESLELGDNFFTGKIPIDGEQKNLAMIDLSRNRFTGSIPSSIGKNNKLYDIFLSRNELTGNIPNEIGNLKYSSHISMSFNRIKGTVPSDVRKLIDLKLLHLHGNQIEGNADYLETPPKSYITDCGNTFTTKALTTCETCSECCTDDGDCLKVQSTWPQPEFKEMFTYMDSPFGVLAIALGVVVALFGVCVMLKKIIGKRLPSLPFKAKIKFQEFSVYKFFLVPDARAWLVGFVAVVIQLYILYIFIRAADFTYKWNDWQYSLNCPNNVEKCDDSRLVTPSGWVIFGAIMFAFLFKDLVDSLLVIYECLTSDGGLRDFVAGFVVLYITLVLFIASTLYNLSTGLSDTDLLKDVVILLFLSELDEKFYEIVKHLFPTWTEQIRITINDIPEEINEMLPDLDHSKESNDQDVVTNDKESPDADHSKNNNDQDALANDEEAPVVDPTIESNYQVKYEDSPVIDPTKKYSNDQDVPLNDEKRSAIDSTENANDQDVLTNDEEALVVDHSKKIL